MLVGATAAAVMATATVASAGGAAAADRDGRLFSSDAPLELTLKAPLSELFDTAERDDKFPVRGSLEVRDPASGNPALTIADVEVTVRGHTSRRESECPFPKLKLKLGDRAAPAGSILDGVGTLRVGTHCGENAGEELTAGFGRLANETSPVREVFAYHLLDALGVPTLKARAARITYIDTRPGATPLTRSAMLLEDESAATRRLGGTADIDVNEFTSARDSFQPLDTARLALAEAMLGNFDWCLRQFPGDTYRCDAKLPLWNILALERPGQPALPVMTDFDLAGVVVGRHNWYDTVYGDGFVSSRSPIETEVLSQVQRTRSLFPRVVLDEARAYFRTRQAAAYDALAHAALDPRGRELARQHLDAFFAAIADDAFYRPVVVRPGTAVYKDAGASAPACGAGDAVPAGTPVNVVGSQGEMAQVAVLDVHWRWAPPRDCPAIRSGTVWISRSAIGEDYPARDAR